jgi:hypothetical protein
VSDLSDDARMLRADLRRFIDQRRMIARALKRTAEESRAHLADSTQLIEVRANQSSRPALGGSRERDRKGQLSLF